MAAFVEVLIVALVLFGVAAVAVGRFGAMAEPPADGWRPVLPEDVDAADVEAVRFPLAFRGYRMADVDDVLDRLAAQLRTRDEELRRLRAQLAGSSTAPGADRAPSPRDRQRQQIGDPGTAE